MVARYWTVRLRILAAMLVYVGHVIAGVLQAQTPEESLLDDGFRFLYELKADEARASFAAWQAFHTDDPLAGAAEAASYLFEECYKQGILTSEFFLDDDRFFGEKATAPDETLRTAFLTANLRARALARLQLERHPEDANALFALTLSFGMEADHASLIEKHQLESLGMIREADQFARRLLAINPDAQMPI